MHKIASIIAVATVNEFWNPVSFDHHMAIDPSGNNVERRTPAAVTWAASLAGAALLAWLITRSLSHPRDTQHFSHVPRLWGVGILPFIGILSAIAILPLIHATHRWWESNRNRLIVSLVFAGATTVYYAIVEGAHSVPTMLENAVVGEYVPFIMLLFCLYVISGGINMRGDLPAHPITNTAFLAFGALIASLVGTTGASMLLIRPLLQTNSERKHVVHTVIFFIFLVSNIGGSLLPIGDPPLFLGYLRGVPFLWTLVLWKEWAFCCIALLITYFVWDSIAYKKETHRDIQRDETQRKPLQVRGLINLLWLAGVVVAVWQLVPQQPLAGTSFTVFPFMRELVMLMFVGLSLVTTPRGVRHDNRFNYAAIIEVAALFIGIFITMQVPLAVLNVKGAELGMDQPWEFFWATGGLSSFLDNAPTYLVFFQTANALTHAEGDGIFRLLDGNFIRTDLLIAISLGSVFMGANTYIGNGPNFMVKSIAEQSGVKMPSFFGYMIKYSLPILVPLFVLVTIIFLR
jgi:Na+/H+ antiporter NhaD/arsenite permease-like protein